MHLKIFLLITKEYKIEMNLEKNEGKIVDTIFEKKEYFSNKMLDNDSIEKVEFLSNLNIYIRDKKYDYFCNDINFEKKYDNDLEDHGTTFEIKKIFYLLLLHERGFYNNCL